MNLKNIVILLLNIVLVNVAYGQKLKYDDSFQFEIGMSRSVPLYHNGIKLQNNPNLFAFNMKFAGLFFSFANSTDECDNPFAGGSEEVETFIFKVGAGLRWDFDKKDRNSIAFTPFIGSQMYRAPFMLKNIEQSTFLFGSAITYYHKYGCITGCISNRDVSLTLGLRITGKQFISSFF